MSSAAGTDLVGLELEHSLGFTATPQGVADKRLFGSTRTARWFGL